LRHLEPSQTTLITLVEPVVATILGVVALSERPSTVAWLGVLIVIASLLTESRTTSKNMRH
jgi:drug/metabolite transporter (DMT)-like permease